MGPTGSPSRRRPTTPQLVFIGTALVATLVVGTGLLLMRRDAHAPAPSQGTATTPRPFGSGPIGGPSSAPSGDWQPVALGAIPAIATVTAPAPPDGVGIASDATFTLTSLGDEPAASLAARLVAVPSASFAVEPAGDGRTAIVKPTERLTAGGTYRIALRGPDGTLQGSWAFHVRGPVRVATTIPGDGLTAVPVGTGIEVTFDQDGVADMADHFTIVPAVTGRFERHGRTQVFVPSGLQPGTLYTVTVAHGLPRTGTELVLDRDVVVRFETAAEDRSGETKLRFVPDVVEVAPTDAPVLAVDVIAPEREDGSEGAPPTTAKVVAYRLPSLDRAGTELAGFLAAPRWTEYAAPRVETDGLPVALSFDATLTRLVGDRALIRFPDRLDAGWYVVEIPGPRAVQAFLQVTALSAWSAVLVDRTVVWVNDVATRHAVPDATVRLDGGPTIGRTDARGLVNAPTPAAVLPPSDEDATTPASPLLRITTPSGAGVFVPFERSEGEYEYLGDSYGKSVQADPTFWSILSTDRVAYRRDDTIQVWGYLRDRDDRSVPSKVEVRLVTLANGGSPDAPPLASATARPVASGAYTAHLSFVGLPIDSYQLQALVNGRVVSSKWLDVTVLRKPAYRVAVAANHRVVFSGTRVRWTATTTFYDGTPVPGITVRFTGAAGGEKGIARTTAADGMASVTTTTHTERWVETSDFAGVDVVPSTPEGAQIMGSAHVSVFPSAYYLDANGNLDADRLTVSGTLKAIDLARTERLAGSETWDGVPAGRPLAGKSVSATVVELIPTRRLTGYEYDFVEKVVRPVYDYSTTRREVGSRSVKTGAEGRLRISLTVPSRKHDYEILLTAVDPQGRVQHRTVYASPAISPFVSQEVMFRDQRGRSDDGSYRMGERIVLRMGDGTGNFQARAGERYLYLVAQRGLQGLAVTDSPTFRHTFKPADAPGIFIVGVRFTGSTYTPKAASWADFDERERVLKVSLATDRARYRPGEVAKVSVRTTDARGRPVAASVVLQAVDEKLYTLGAAEVARPLDDLYQGVDTGLRRVAATHQLPSLNGDGGGDTGGGGGDRTDFVDTLVFGMLQTDASGRASTSVRLSDDLTSWHFTASAVTKELQAGSGEHLVPVGLPFFVELTLADDYLVSDRPVIGVRAFGERLKLGDPVEFTIESKDLGLAPTKVKGKAFVAVSVALPKLRPGTPAITVTGRAPTRRDASGSPLTDRLTRTVGVIPSRLTTARIAYATVGAELPAATDTAGLTTYTFTDAGRGAMLPLLLDVVERGGMRLDRVIAQSEARGLLIGTFGRSPASLPAIDLDESRYPLGVNTGPAQDETHVGVSLLPWSAPDPWLTARVAAMAPDSIGGLTGSLEAIRQDPAMKRDLGIATLAGLASVGQPVLPELHAAAGQPDLTTQERLYLALGFAAAGDDAAALEIERALLADHGERLGPWVRLRAGDEADQIAVDTAMLAVVAGSLGDPLGADMAAYVMANPAHEAVLELELAAYAKRALERLPASDASFAYTLAGSRRVVKIEPGESFTLAVTDAQRRDLTLETVSGAVGVALEDRAVVDAASLVSSPDVTLARKTVKGPLRDDRIVTVDLTATFKDAAPGGCYLVVEHVPSGLAPLTPGYEDEGEDQPARVTWPMSVAGQEVRFCADHDPKKGAVHLRYRARVVNTGTFTWEPAVMQLPNAPELLAVAPGQTIQVGR